MPTYQYACKACDHRFEQVQSFTDNALTECPQCSGPLRKLYGSVGVVFKGSGFYRTDSRASSTGASTGSSGKSESGKSESKSAGKSSDSSSSSSSSSSNSSSSTSTTTASASKAS